MIARILYGSLRRRFQPLAAIALSATVAAGTLAAAAGLGARLEAGAAADLHASGPNLLVRPQVGGPEGLPASEVARVAATPGVLAAAGLALVPRAALLVGGADGAPTVVLTPPGEGRLPVLAATESLFELRPRWEVARSRPAPAGSLRLAPGAAFLGARAETTSDGAPVGAPKGARVLPTAGTVATGEAVDGGVVVPLSDLPRTGAAGIGGSSDRMLDRILDRIEVRADPARLEEVARAIEARVPGAEARPLRHVTATEAGVVRKLQLLMLGVGAICLLLALATVGSATLALLDERRREMALFLSLGYTGRWIQGLMSAELAFVGLVSVLAGEAAAALLARSLLDGLGGAEAVAGFRPSIAGIAAGVVVVALLVALATALVRFRVERLDPAPVLHGR